MVIRYQSCVLKNSGIFQDLDKGLKKNLEKHGVLMVLQNKKAIASEFQVENRIYVVAEGRAFLSCFGENGKKIILDVLEEGNIFGNLDFLGEDNNDNLFVEPFPKTIVKISEFKKEEFLNTISESPTLAVNVLAVFTRRLFGLERKIEALAFSDTKARLLSELIRLGKPSSADEDLIRVSFRITHEMLAQITGATRETVSKILSELKKEGTIHYNPQKNFVIDLEKMRTVKKEVDKKMKILVIEDDKFISRAFTDCLKRAGFGVSVAFDGQEAIEKIDSELPDLILLDLILPRKSGLEVLDSVNKGGKQKNLPVVVISNLDQDSDIKKSKELGAADYLVKSNLTMEKIVKNVKSHLPQAQGSG